MAAKDEAFKITNRIRTFRRIVLQQSKEPTTGVNAVLIAQLQRHVKELQNLVLAQGRLLSLLVDPEPDDLIDDGF